MEFGTNRDEIRDLLGAPDEIEAFTFTEEQLKGEDWHYDEFELSMSFDEASDWTLSTIATSNPRCSFSGLRPIGMSEASFVEALELLELGEFQKENFKDEDGEESLMIVYPSLKIYFWIVEGEVSEIELRDWA